MTDEPPTPSRRPASSSGPGASWPGPGGRPARSTTWPAPSRPSPPSWPRCAPPWPGSSSSAGTAASDTRGGVEAIGGELHRLRAHVDAVRPAGRRPRRHRRRPRRRRPPHGPGAGPRRRGRRPPRAARPGPRAPPRPVGLHPVLEPRAAAGDARCAVPRPSSTSCRPRSRARSSILDDASTDATPAVAAALAAEDPRIRVIRSDENLGLGHARSTLLHAARTRHALQLDADDDRRRRRRGRPLPHGRPHRRRVTFGTVVQADADGAALGAVSNEPPTAAFFRSNYIGTIAVSDLAVYREMGGWPTDPLLEHVDDWASLHQVITEGRLLAFVPTLAAVYREWPTGFHHTVPDPRLGQERIARVFDPRRSSPGRRCPRGRGRGRHPPVDRPAVGHARGHRPRPDPRRRPRPRRCGSRRRRPRVLLVGPGRRGQPGRRRHHRARHRPGPGRVRARRRHRRDHRRSARPGARRPDPLAPAAAHGDPRSHRRPARAPAARPRARPRTGRGRPGPVAAVRPRGLRRRRVPRLRAVVALGRGHDRPPGPPGRRPPHRGRPRGVLRPGVRDRRRRSRPRWPRSSAAPSPSAAGTTHRPPSPPASPASTPRSSPSPATTPWGWPRRPTPSTRAAPGRPTLAVTVRRADYVGAPEDDPVRRWALAADALAAARGWDVLGVALNAQPPEPEIVTLATLRATVPLQARWRLVECGSDPARLVAAVSGAVAVATQSYHAALFGLGAGVPSVLGAASAVLRGQGGRSRRAWPGCRRRSPSPTPTTWPTPSTPSPPPWPAAPPPWPRRPVPPTPGGRPSPPPWA